MTDIIDKVSEAIRRAGADRGQDLFDHARELARAAIAALAATEPSAGPEPNDPEELACAIEDCCEALDDESTNSGAVIDHRVNGWEPLRAANAALRAERDGLRARLADPGAWPDAYEAQCLAESRAEQLERERDEAREQLREAMALLRDARRDPYETTHHDMWRQRFAALEAKVKP